MFFGLFSTQPPLPVREKAWTEVRMRWLARQFGIDRLLKAPVILPDENNWFPEDYEGTTDDARCLFDRLCGVMQITPSSIHLEISEDAETPCAAGQHEVGLIRLAANQLADPLGLVAVLAHELAHRLLIDRGLRKDDLDAACVTDLLPVYLGLGIFTANATLGEKAEHQGHHCSCTSHCRGYLNSGILGYALALFAWVRGERRPDWAKFLRLDVAHALAAGLRYLDASKDSLFGPETCRSADHPTSWSALMEEIEGGSASTCVAGMWELAQRPYGSREDLEYAVNLVRQHLSHRLPELRAEAARTLAALGSAAEPAVDDLLRLLVDTNSDVRMASVYTLGRLCMQPENVVPNLVDAIDDSDLLRSAVTAIAAYGPAARPAVPRLTSALLTAMAKTEYDNVDCLVHAIEATSADPAAEFRHVLADCDKELRPQAERILADRHPVPTGTSASRRVVRGMASAQVRLLTPWNVINLALRKGFRGLPGGSTLAQLLVKRRGMRDRRAFPKR